MDNKKTLETSEIKDFYTILEVSKILNMSQKSVRRYVASGELDSSRSTLLTVFRKKHWKNL